MSNYFYFDDSFDFTVPSLGLDHLLDLQSGKPQLNSPSESENSAPSYNALYKSGAPPNFLSLPDHITYPNEFPLDEKPNLHYSSADLPSLDLEKPVPFPEAHSTDRRSLPPYAVLSNDDNSGDVLLRAPAGLLSPPLPLTPPPRYEAQLQANGGQRIGRRKALCIGVNYYTRRRGRPELTGCINDARNMQKLLIERYHYRPEDMLLLSDDPTQRNRMLMPTRDNILRAMQWLVHGAQSGDSLVFQFAGHGSQVPDEDGDEEDNLDEVILPVDYKANGPIVDDEMHDILVKLLPSGCRLTVIFDCCHSGSALDLPCLYSRHPWRGVLGSRNRYAMRSKSSSADVVCWSACRDSEEAADVNASGVMSKAFISALEDGREHTYRSLFMAVDSAVCSNPRLKQRPQLSSSRPLDIAQGFTM